MDGHPCLRDKALWLAMCIVLLQYCAAGGINTSHIHKGKGLLEALSWKPLRLCSCASYLGLFLIYLFYIVNCNLGYNEF